MHMPFILIYFPLRAIGSLLPASAHARLGRSTPPQQERERKKSHTKHLQQHLKNNMQIFKVSSGIYHGSECNLRFHERFSLHFTSVEISCQSSNIYISEKYLLLIARNQLVYHELLLIIAMPLQFTRLLEKIILFSSNSILYSVFHFQPLILM